jgi:hypothetical protein
MILYDLVCPKDHRFESWFRNSNAVEKLIKAGEVSCPACGSKKVQKAPMAPRIAKGASTEKALVAKNDGEVTEAMERAMKAFAELRDVIEKKFENVGERFPEEARKIHYGETPGRGIYGDASPEEAEALRDEGIEVQVIPWKRRKDA